MPQKFVWVDERGEIASLIVNHRDSTMLLSVSPDVAEQVRAQMIELNNGYKVYPNQEMVCDTPTIQFIISGGYNWNARWRDFKTILSNLLGCFGKEITDVTEE